MLTLKKPRIEPILAWLKQLHQRRGLGEALRIKLLTTDGQLADERMKAILKCLRFQGADNAQANRAGNQASQCNIQKQTGGLLQADLQRCGDDAKHDWKMSVQTSLF